MQNVRFTLRHAQAAIMNLCCSETVIVGHALHNDLMAMRVNHLNVVDTACLYSVSDHAHQTPALREIAETLGLSMNVKHDSVVDARVALQAAAHAKRELGSDGRGELPQIQRTATSAADADSELLVHRIPAGITAAQISELIMRETSIQPLSCEAIQWTTRHEADRTSEDHGRAALRFRSARHAELAFDSIPGPAVSNEKDKRLQKKVLLGGSAPRGQFVKVRNMK